MGPYFRGARKVGLRRTGAIPGLFLGVWVIVVVTNTSAKRTEWTSGINCVSRLGNPFFSSSRWTVFRTKEKKDGVEGEGTSFVG